MRNVIVQRQPISGAAIVAVRYPKLQISNYIHTAYLQARCIACVIQSGVYIVQSFDCKPVPLLSGLALLESQTKLIMHRSMSLIIMHIVCVGVMDTQLIHTIWTEYRYRSIVNWNFRSNSMIDSNIKIKNYRSGTQTNHQHYQLPFWTAITSIRNFNRRTSLKFGVAIVLDISCPVALSI